MTEHLASKNHSFEGEGATSAPRSLSDALLAQGVPRQVLDSAQRRQKHRSFFEGRTFSLEQVIRDDRLVDAERLNAALFNLRGQVPPVQVDLPLAIRKRLKLKVLTGVEGGVLKVGVALPLRDADKNLLIGLVRQRGIECHDVHSTPISATEALESANLHAVDVAQLALSIDRLNRDPDSGEIDVSKLIQAIVHEAAELGVSDIHLNQNTSPQECYVSYRIAKEHRRVHYLSEQGAKALMAVLKQMSAMDAANRFSNQDGRLSVGYQDRTIDIRVSVTPLEGGQGEAAVMRVLDPRKMVAIGTSFKDFPEVKNRLQKIVRNAVKRQEFNLISGMTDSGKSTTMYSCISEMDREAFRVWSVEDPIEQRIPGVHQVQVNAAAGLTFASAIVSFMRKGPDVVVVGEIRDPETLVESVKAMESGHPVWATVHAGSVRGMFERVSRLLPPGEREAGMLSVCMGLRIALNQRLSKTLCSCAKFVRADEHPDPDLREFARQHGYSQLSIGLKEGCPLCNHTGYSPRVVLIPEAMFVPDDEDLRMQMYRLFEQGETASITRLPGIFYQSVAESARILLGNHRIDLETALRHVGTKTA